MLTQNPSASDVAATAHKKVLVLYYERMGCFNNLNYHHTYFGRWSRWMCIISLQCGIILLKIIIHLSQNDSEVLN